jgi:hypothetical protein
MTSFQARLTLDRICEGQESLLIGSIHPEERGSRCKRRRNRRDPKGKTYWVKAKVPESVDTAMQKDIDRKFRKYYTVSKSNYMVEDMYIPKPV